MSQPQIRPTNSTAWTNRHDTFTQPIDNLFDLINGSSGNGFDDYNAMTDAIQLFLGRAIAENKTVRPLGGGWSFSKVAAADGWILNTKMLNMLFPIRNPQSLSPQYANIPDTAFICPVRHFDTGIEQLVKTEQKIIKNFRRQQRTNYCRMFFDRHTWFRV